MEVRWIVLVAFVTKADGTRQLFDRKKVVRTCLRMGATENVAEAIAEKIEGNISDGLETRRILQMIFSELSKYKPEVKHLIDLRRALALMKPKPDFERFIQILLNEHGYKVLPNLIIRGKCVEHEVDAIARKDGQTYIVEVKHHFNYHALTDLDTSRIVRAVFEDITDGFNLGINNLKTDKAMIVCNTKFSGHAERYAECRGISCIGWSSPPEHNLRTMIVKKKLYPLTCLKGVTTATIERFEKAGIILIKQLNKKNPEELKKETGLPKKRLDSIIKRAGLML